MNLVKRVFHMGLLAFTAFWLLATSRASVPARDCFRPLACETVNVTLGVALPPSDASVPSCHGRDGLEAGATLRVRLAHGALRPALRTEPDEACWGYEVRELSGPEGLSQVQSVHLNSLPPRVFFEARAKFMSPGTPANCLADYRIVLSPERSIPPEARIDLLDAGRNESWSVRRTLWASSNEVCASVPALPTRYCEDVFEVRGAACAP